MRRLVTTNGRPQAKYFGSSYMTFYPMNTVECSSPSKAHVPDTYMKHGRRLNAEDIASDKGATKGEEEQPQKCVTMATTSRYLTDRQYVMREPLFSVGQLSILKKTQQLHQLRSQSAGADLDKEFWSLPDHLERNVLLLTRQVKDATARLNCPVTPICDGLDYTSIFSIISQPRKELAKNGDAKLDKSKRDDGSAAININKSATESGLTQESLQEGETLVEQLCGLYLKDPQKVVREDQDQNCSLMQHTHMFCSLLDQYIHWLYKASDKIEMLARPTVDNDNMKRSLPEYQRFQREVSSHKHLTSHILQTGEMLLSCMDSTFPLLRNMLVLIEGQSRTIANHTKHLESSILSAIDVNNQTHVNQDSDPVQ
ncbi:centrosomal protein of 68 kDa isoform X7 [Syngnathoides biaculeatus]|uniref:centrosomal protein of 68 kDa isoform X7 n=1 Tax=Syngnathoides biaculeatus TaxID=300417 RepID=UPI002ADD4068|nr:centrosomal protein of 68 kDa isoform X7 [Syngnathoides biaculeatus]